MNRKTMTRLMATTLALALLIITMSTAFAETTAGKTNSSVNLRSAPSTSASKISTLGSGTTVTILATIKSGETVDGTTADGDWLKISASGKTGYVSALYVDLSSVASGGESGSTPKIVTASNLDGYDGEFITVNGQKYQKAYINASNVALRQGPNTTSAKLATLPKNAAVALAGYATDYFKVVYSGQTGYVATQYVRLTGSAFYVTTASPTPSTSAASTSGAAWTPVADAPAAILTASEAAYWQTIPSLYSEYKALNKQTYGFLAIPNTNVRYPIMYSGDDYYLTRGIYKTKDSAGLPYIHKSHYKYNPQRHIVVAGHNLSKSGRMFNQLSKYKNLEFYLQNPIISFNFLGVQGEWQVFSDHISKPDTRYIQMKFSSDADWLSYINWLETEGDHYGKVPDVALRSNDVVLTLYTCTYESWLGVKGRYFVHFRRIR